MAAPTSSASCANKASTAISTALFYSLPKERPKRFVRANLLDVIDTNESDFSADEGSEDELSGDSSGEEWADSTEADEAEAEVPSMTDIPARDGKSSNAKKRYTWLKKEFDNEAVSFQNDFPLPPAEPLSAKQYFDMFVSRSMLKAVVDESNKYYFQKHGTPLNLTVEELTSVLGMFFRMGLVNMHMVRAYWKSGSRYELVAQVMSRNRFEKITSHLHFFDNEAATEKIKEDKCWKVRPRLTSLRSNMIGLPQEKKSAVDEVLIPFRGRCYIRQYMPNKPKSKWGLKVWARSGESGLCYDFDVYQRCNKGFYGYQDGYQLGLGAGVVLQLCSSLPKRDDNLVVADNFFTGPHLVEELTKMGISYIGTVRKNRLNCVKLMDDKLMKKRGRGTCDTSVASCDQKTMVAVKWYDNRSVTLLSNCIGTNPVTSVKRWNSKEKKHVFVDCPAIIPAYNRSMGGVDLLDKMCFSYRFPIRSKRWYMYLFWHTLKMAAVNAWLMQKRILQQQGSSPPPLREFLSELATSLILHNKRPPRRP
ncbi:piggyBac transposable element-derived protein 3-like [Dermacentor albipictus]|uniref:piggyBac transposable element-derived protein 3-like n=1 Tax=Dermacentor albipictus TaxID=60249 RepID=UPI0038FD3539